MTVSYTHLDVYKRQDYLHKMSHEIISENQVIVSENLQIKNMVKNHHLAKAISLSLIHICISVLVDRCGDLLRRTCDRNRDRPVCITDDPCACLLYTSRCV